MRVFCRLARQVAGVEFGKGGVDVIDVEHDKSNGPVLGVDLGEAEHLSVKRLGPLVEPEETVTAESKAFCTLAMTVCAMFLTPTWAVACQSAMTTSVPRRIPTPTSGRRSSVDVSSTNSSDIASHSRPAKWARRRSTASACRIFESRCVPAEFVEPRERGIEVILIEDLAAA